MTDVPRPVGVTRSTDTSGRVRGFERTLDEQANWILLGALALAVALLHGMLHWFSARLDVPAPDPGTLQGLLFLYAGLALASAGLLLWMEREGRIHMGWLIGGIVTGALIGGTYGLTTYAEDFYDVLIFQRLHGYTMTQLILLLPLTVVSWAIAGFRAWLRPDGSSRLTLTFLYVPFALQVGFHGILVVVIWSSLDSLTEVARQVHESSGASLWALVMGLIGLLAMARRRSGA